VSAPTVGGGGRPPTQAPTAATGQPYGSAGAQIAAQKAVPLPGATPGTAPDFASTVAAAQGHAFDPIGLGGPTTRPDEPVTAGLMRGPGAGRSPGSGSVRDPQVVAELRALYSQFPNEDIRELLEDIERGVTF
jgi:hypothetical protein